MDRLLATFLQWRVEKRAHRIEAELLQRCQICIAHGSRSWQHMHASISFEKSVSLVDQIEIFAVPFEEYVRRHHSILLSRPGLFHLLLFNAVIDAKTHSTDQVKAAVDALTARYLADIQ